MTAKTNKIDRVAVVGGGITGLAAAHRLLELTPGGGKPIQIRLLERGPRLGGVIRTLTRDGFLMESGPDSFITDKPAALKLAARLDLENHLIRTRKTRGRSFVVRKGRLHPTPDGFYLLAPSRILPFLTTRILSPLGKLRAGLDLFLPARPPQGDESIGGFVARRLGQEALDRLAQPMIGAIYGADPMRLSLLGTFPRFRQMEREHGSIIRALWAAGRKRQAADGNLSNASGPRYGLFASFDGGQQILVEALRKRIPADAVRTGIEVKRIRPEPEGGWRVISADSEEVFQAVILSLPAGQAARIVGTFDQQLRNHLTEIPYGYSATVSLGFRQEDVTHPLDGFGFVVPSKESLSLLGCTFTHQKYAGRAPDGHVLLRVFHGQASESLTDPELLDRTLQELRPLVGLRGSPVVSHMARFPASLPHYPVGHPDLVGRIAERVRKHPGLALAGNAYGGIGIPDCIHSGESAAEAILAHLHPDRRTSIHSSIEEPGSVLS